MTELTDAEREALAEAGVLLSLQPVAGVQKIHAAVESIVAARLSALTAERDELKRRDEHYEILLQDNLRLSAELAAANAQRQSRVYKGERIADVYAERDALAARCAELERERDLAIAHDTQPYPTAEAYEKVCAARTKWHEETKALQARLDRVTANCTCGATDE